MTTCVLLLAACSQDAAAPVDAGADAKVAGPRSKVDVLFMIDDSAGMEPMARELRSQLASVLHPLADLTRFGVFPDLHVGVVTSDEGTGAGGCEPSPGARLGRLQAIGARAPAGCEAPTDAHFIRYVYDATGGSHDHNLPPGQSLAETLGCMASVGDEGCNFEHPLESVYAALHDDVPENRGFVRDDALLVVVFVTNEDDGSAPPGSRVYDARETERFGPATDYFRQTRPAICCAPGRNNCAEAELLPPPWGASNGELANCEAAPNSPPGLGPGEQYDVRRYVDFFAKPRTQGGAKPNPLDVILVGVTAPEAPVEVILADPDVAPGESYRPCDVFNDSGRPRCLPVLQHSCRNREHPEWFGDPAVRLARVIRTASKEAIYSICDGSYRDVLHEVAWEIVQSTGAGCWPVLAHQIEPVDPDKIMFQCPTFLRVVNPDGSESLTPLPQCPGNGANPGPDPCYRFESKEICKGFTGGVALTIDYAGQPPLAHAQFEVRCDPF